MKEEIRAARGGKICLEAGNLLRPSGICDRIRYIRHMKERGDAYGKLCGPGRNQGNEAPGHFRQENIREVLRI